MYENGERELLDAGVGVGHPMTERKVTKDRQKHPVVSNLRLPDDHYQPGDVASVTVEGATVTIRPKAPWVRVGDKRIAIECDGEAVVAPASSFAPCDCANCAPKKPKQKDEIAAAEALYEKLAAMDLVCEGGAYRFTPKKQKDEVFVPSCVGCGRVATVEDERNGAMRCIDYPKCSKMFFAKGQTP